MRHFVQVSVGVALLVSSAWPALASAQQLSCEQMQAICELFDNLPRDDADHDGCPDAQDDHDADPNVSCTEPSYCDALECGASEPSSSNDGSGGSGPSTPPPAPSGGPTPPAVSTASPSATSTVSSGATPTREIHVRGLRVFSGYRHPKLGYVNDFHFRVPDDVARMLRPGDVLEPLDGRLQRVVYVGNGRAYCLDEHRDPASATDEFRFRGLRSDRALSIVRDAENQGQPASGVIWAEAARGFLRL